MEIYIGSQKRESSHCSECGKRLQSQSDQNTIPTGHRNPGKYAFFVDVTFDKPEDYFKAKSLLEIMATTFKVLGEYPSGK